MSLLTVSLGSTATSWSTATGKTPSTSDMIESVRPALQAAGLMFVGVQDPVVDGQPTNLIYDRTLTSAEQSTVNSTVAAWDPSVPPAVRAAVGRAITPTTRITGLSLMNVWTTALRWMHLGETSAVVTYSTAGDGVGGFDLRLYDTTAGRQLSTVNTTVTSSAKPALLSLSLLAGTPLTGPTVGNGIEAQVRLLNLCSRVDVHDLRVDV